MSQYEIRNHRLLKDGEPVRFVQSPNHGGEIEPTVIVIHYDGTSDTKPSRGGLKWLISPESRVSAHFWVGKDGEIVQLLPCNIKAWHAGVSSWDGQDDCNSFSIGIEQQGSGKDWPDAQVEATIGIIVALHKVYPIEGTCGHEDVAPGRKVDPGPNWDWDRVSEALREVGYL